MAKLTNLAPLLGTLPSRIATQPRDEAARSAFRAATTPWRKWYGLKRWKDIRWSVLVRDKFTCQLCDHIEPNTSLLVCDHVTPHRGDPDLFWNGPFETLCQQCHSIDKQSQEQGTTAKHHPDWLRPSGIPLTIICGPPCSGKSTYAHDHAAAFDVVIDLDAIASGLSGQPLHSWDRERWLQPALRKRNAMLAYLSRNPRWKRAWFIIGEPKAEHRAWWAKQLQPIEVVVLATPAQACIERARKDNQRNLERTTNAIESWWSNYTPRQDDRIIASQGEGV